jgi:hypothetical protein
MSQKIIPHKYRLKRAKAEVAEKLNPLLLEGEPIVITEQTNKGSVTKLKIGDGKTLYNELPFLGGEGSGFAEINEPCHIADLDVGTYVIKSNWLEGPAEEDLVKVTLCNTDEEGNIDENFWEIYSGTVTINARYEEEFDGETYVVTSFVANGNMNTPNWYSLSEMQDDDGNIYMQNDICCIKNASNAEVSLLVSVKYNTEQEGIEANKWYSSLDRYWGVPTSDIPASALTETIDKNSGRFEVPTAKAVYDYVKNLNPAWDTTLIFDGGDSDVQLAVLDETILL